MLETEVSKILNNTDQLSEGQLNALKLSCEAELMFRDTQYLDELERKDQERFAEEVETS